MNKDEKDLIDLIKRIIESAEKSTDLSHPNYISVCLPQMVFYKLKLKLINYEKSFMDGVK